MRLEEADAPAPNASVTETVTIVPLDAVGTPEIAPVAGSIARPAGRPLASNRYGPVPPTTCAAAL